MPFSKYNKVVVTGSIGRDTIMDFRGSFVDYIQPDKIHKLNVSFVANKMDKQIGGTGTNIVYNYAMLDKESCTLVGAVGKDGGDILTFLKSNRIDVSKVYVDNDLFTATGTVVTDLNNNQIWSFYYGACEKAEEINLDKIVDKDTLLVIAPNHKTVITKLQREAVAKGIDYVYDPGMAASDLPVEILREGIENCKVLIGNDYEISNILKLIGKNKEDFLNAGKIIITTLSEKGVMYEEGENQILAPGYKVDRVEDPTGAGDAWRGGFLACTVGKKKSVEESMFYGNVMASFAVEKFGTVNHKPTAEEIDKRVDFLKNL